MPYLSASAVVIHYVEALYQVYAPLHLDIYLYAGTRLKKILLANGLESNMHQGQSQFLQHGCPVNQCSVTAKQEDAATADLILFNGHIWRPAVPRPPHQIWVLFMLESPMHTPSLTNFDGQVTRLNMQSIITSLSSPAPCGLQSRVVRIDPLRFLA